MLIAEDWGPIARLGCGIISTAVSAGAAVAGGIAGSTTGAAILNSAGWHLSSVGLSMHEIVLASAAGSAVIAGSVAACVGACAGGAGGAAGTFSAGAMSFVGGAAVQLFALPAGAAMLHLLHSGSAVGYSFAAGAIGDLVIGTSSAIALACLGAGGVGVFALFEDSMGNLNLLKIPEKKLSQEKNNQVIDLEALPHPEILPVQAVFPNAPDDATVLKVITEKTGISLENPSFPSEENKKLYLNQVNIGNENSFDHIREQEPSFSATKRRINAFS
ncbi:MAG: hypothetical protein RLZ35_322 [Pseudomonadota bacterium]|jgi:hypothetical protein